MERIRELTARERLALPVEQIVRELNGFLRGWAGYFPLWQLDPFVPQDEDSRDQPLGAARGQAPRTAGAVGWALVVHASADLMGLHNLDGTVVAPRPIRGWREKPNAGGEGRR